MTATVHYKGDLRTLCTHNSGEQITTDAPLDNHGLGACFSPTDLLATSLASCFLTIVGIYCNERQIPFIDATVHVEKIMASNPRRISEIKLFFDFSKNAWEEPTLKKIIAAGKSCPVALTLGSQVKIEYDFK